MFGTTEDVFYADGSMDRQVQIWNMEAAARKRTEHGAYLRRSLKGAKTPTHKWDGRARSWKPNKEASK